MSEMLDHKTPFYPFADELQTMLLHHFRDRCRMIAIYGSVAQGTAHPDSDIDVYLVVNDLPRSPAQRSRLLEPLLPLLYASTTLDALNLDGGNRFPTFYLATPEEHARHPKIMLDMTESVWVLYDPEGLMPTEMTRLKARMAELGSYKQKFLDGSYIWWLKKGAAPGEEVWL